MEPAAKPATCLRAGRGWCNILLPRVSSQEFSAPVVQLDRIPGFEPGGCRFESCRVRHFLMFELFDVTVTKKPFRKALRSIHFRKIAAKQCCAHKA